MSPIIAVMFGVLLFLTGAIAYTVGRTRRHRYESPVIMGRKDVRRAESTADDMIGTLQSLKTHLSAHEVAISQFKSQIARIRSLDNTIELSEIAEEAEQLLQPTTKMGARLVESYDQLRLYGNILRSYRDLRHDPLTGLQSRRSLNETLRMAIQMIMRNPERQLVVAIADIDQFGEINGRLGNRYGDRMLKAVAEIMSQSVRETDVVARTGGNEFVVVLPDSDAVDASTLAERVRSKIDQEFPFKLSIGIAVSIPGDSPVTLLARADSSLGAAKAEGGDRIFLHNGDTIELVEVTEKPSMSPKAKQQETTEQAEDLLEEMISVSDEPSLTDVLTDQA